MRREDQYEENKTIAGMKQSPDLIEIEFVNPVKIGAH